MSLGTVAAIGYFDIKRYLRDKIALFTTLFLPVLLILVIGVATGGGGGGSLSVGVVDSDGTAASAEFAEGLSAAALDVTFYDDARDMATDVRLGAISAGIEIEPGFGAALASPEGTAEVVMNLDQASTSGTAVAASITSVASEFALGPTAVRVSEAAVDAPGEVVRPTAEQLAPAVTEQMPPITVSGQLLGTVRESDVNGYATAVPTQLTLFVFLNGMLAGMTLVESRRLGVARRMLATPTGIGPHILGAGMGRWVLGMIQAAILLAVGAVLFGVNFGNWPAVVLLAVMWAALAAGVGMVAGAVAKTPDQVVAVSVPLGIGMAMLGGSMWPLSVVPPFMRTIGHLTPHAWANDAWNAIINEGAGIAGILPELGVLTAITVVLAGLSVVLLRRSLSH